MNYFSWDVSFICSFCWVSMTHSIASSSLVANISWPFSCKIWYQGHDILAKLLYKVYCKSLASDLYPAPANCMNNSHHNGNPTVQSTCDKLQDINHWKAVLCNQILHFLHQTTPAWTFPVGSGNSKYGPIYENTTRVHTNDRALSMVNIARLSTGTKCVKINNTLGFLATVTTL